MTSALAVMGPALTAVGQIREGNAANAAAKANATLMEREADVSRQQGSARQEQQMRRARELLGKQRAAIGQAGIGWSGSAADVIQQSETEAALDTMNIGYEAELKARGLINQASITRWEGKQARTAGYIRAGATVMNSMANYGKSGAGSAATMGAG